MQYLYIFVVHSTTFECLYTALTDQNSSSLPFLSLIMWMFIVCQFMVTRPSHITESLAHPQTTATSWCYPQYVWRLMCVNSLKNSSSVKSSLCYQIYLETDDANPLWSISCLFTISCSFLHLKNLFGFLNFQVCISAFFLFHFRDRCWWAENWVYTSYKFQRLR